jgi:hypothetical protein
LWIGCIWLRIVYSIVCFGAPFVFILYCVVASSFCVLQTAITTVISSQKFFEISIDQANIRTNLAEIVWKGVDWIHLFKERDQWRAVLNTVMNLRVP